MSDKMIPINGKEFSESTIANALEKQCGVVFKKRYPIVSLGSYQKTGDRLTIRLTPKMKQALKRTDLKLITICKDGIVRDDRGTYEIPSCYKNQKPIFGEIKDD